MKVTKISKNDNLSNKIYSNKDKDKGKSKNNSSSRDMTDQKEVIKIDEDILSSDNIFIHSIIKSEYIWYDSFLKGYFVSVEYPLFEYLEKNKMIEYKCGPCFTNYNNFNIYQIIQLEQHYLINYSDKAKDKEEEYKRCRRNYEFLNSSIIKEIDFEINSNNKRDNQVITTLSNKNMKDIQAFGISGNNGSKKDADNSICTIPEENTNSFNHISKCESNTNTLPQKNNSVLSDSDNENENECNINNYDYNENNKKNSDDIVNENRRLRNTITSLMSLAESNNFNRLFNELKNIRKSKIFTLDTADTNNINKHTFLNKLSKELEKDFIYECHRLENYYKGTFHSINETNDNFLNNKGYDTTERNKILLKEKISLIDSNEIRSMVEQYKNKVLQSNYIKENEMYIENKRDLASGFASDKKKGDTTVYEKKFKNKIKEEENKINNEFKKIIYKNNPCLYSYN